MTPQDADPETYAWAHQREVRRMDRHIAIWIAIGLVAAAGGLVLIFVHGGG